jgi:hypothetical protein
MPASAPVIIDLPDLPRELDAEVPTPITVVLTRPPAEKTSVSVRQIASKTCDALLTTDSFFGELELGPGEALRVELKLRAQRPGKLSLQDLEVQVDQELYPLGQGTITVRPSLRKEVDVSFEPICTYEQGTKVLVNVAHLGRTTFSNVCFSMAPAAAVRLGKTNIRRPALVPGQQEQFEVVAAPGKLDLEITGDVDGHVARSAWSATVPLEAPRPPERRFRFLEPRGFSRDAVNVFALKDDDEATEVASDQGTYPVCGRERYRVVIRPDAGRHVTKVRLRELPEQVHVNNSATKALPGRWEFEIFIAANTAFTRRARLFYDMESPAGPLTGELHLALLPPSLLHLKFAATLGAAVTLQSVTVLLRTLLGNGPDWLTELARFSPFSGGAYFWMLVSIPLAWGGLRLADRLQLRWKS